MIVCGTINPPPIDDAEYCGVYFSTKDDLPSKMSGLKGTPLKLEHGGTTVGRVLQGWTDKTTGCAWALAEIDVQTVPGATTAAGVQHGAFTEFSLGYNSKMKRNPSTGKLEVFDKQIVELSIVKQGARPGCRIAAHSRSAIQKRK